ncbi:hypothetical protein [Streptomyces sp. NPDC002690]
MYEPPGALDAEAEQRLIEQIRRLADAGQTVVLITHRLAGGRAADEIHVLEEDRGVESGSCDALMSDGHPGPGTFRALYGIQAAPYGVTAAEVPPRPHPSIRRNPAADTPSHDRDTPG